MSIIKIPLLFAGSLGDKHIYRLYDSGANLSCIHPDQVKGLEKPTPLGRSRLMETGSEGHFIKVTHAVRLDFYMNDVLLSDDCLMIVWWLSDEFLIIPGLSEDAIIGAATMQKWRIKLDFEHDKAILDPKVAKMQLI